MIWLHVLGWYLLACAVATPLVIAFFIAAGGGLRK